jgi:hypothetical protein
MPETQSMHDNVTPEDPNFMTGFFTDRTRYRFPILCPGKRSHRPPVGGRKNAPQGPGHVAGFPAEAEGGLWRRLHRLRAGRAAVLGARRRGDGSARPRAGTLLGQVKYKKEEEDDEKWPLVEGSEPWSPI